MNTIKIKIDLTINSIQSIDDQCMIQIRTLLCKGLKQVQQKIDGQEIHIEKKESKKENDFFDFGNEEVGKYKKLQRYNTARNYVTSLKRLKDYIKSEYLNLEDITPQFIEEFENYLKKEGCRLNTISCYIRALRSIYNKAVQNKVIQDKSPFKKAYTQTEKTAKRAISAEFIKIIKETEIAGKKQLDMARDFFMFSFYTRGMPFIDIAFLKKENLKEQHLVYHRQKTHQRMVVKIEQPAKDIIRKYMQKAKGEYLFPIIDRVEPELAYKQYRKALCAYNKKLKALEKITGSKVRLSSYVPRHTWATLAKENGVPIQIISESLGHTSEKTTRIYTAQLKEHTLDNANKQLIKQIIES